MLQDEKNDVAFRTKNPLTTTSSAGAIAAEAGQGKKRFASLRLRWFAFFHLPMLSLARPGVRQWDDQRVTIVLPFNRRNRSFLGGMAFGPMMMAAECAAGFLFGAEIRASKRNMMWLVTQCEARFIRLMRSEGRFEACLEQPIQGLLDAVAAHGKAMDFPVTVLGRDRQGKLCGRYRFTVQVTP